MTKKIKKKEKITGNDGIILGGFCIVEDKRNLLNKTTEQIKLEMKSARERGTTYLEFIGGETFIRPDILKLINSAHKLGFKILISKHSSVGGNINGFESKFMRRINQF